MTDPNSMTAAEYILHELGAGVMDVAITVTPHLQPGRLIAINGPLPGAQGEVHLLCGPEDSIETAEALAEARALYSKGTN